MRKFVKKPVVIEAQQWFPDAPHEAVERNENLYDTKDMFICKRCGNEYRNHGWIETLEGGHTACPGDWIIRGVKGEFYPCKPDIFAETYEEVK